MGWLATVTPGRRAGYGLSAEIAKQGFPLVLWKGYGSALLFEPAITPSRFFSTR